MYIYIYACICICIYTHGRDFSVLFDVLTNLHSLKYKKNIFIFFIVLDPPKENREHLFCVVSSFSWSKNTHIFCNIPESSKENKEIHPVFFIVFFGCPAVLQDETYRR